MINLLYGALGVSVLMNIGLMYVVKWRGQSIVALAAMLSDRETVARIHDHFAARAGR